MTTARATRGREPAAGECPHCDGSGHDPEEYDQDEDGEEFSISTWKEKSRA